jgi:RNA-directed DNA polymerase
MRNTSLRMKSTLPNNITWKQINWVHAQRYVEKLQQRIYRAESLEDKRKVRELQRLLMHSKSALLLSIKRITQINKGKKTAGIDGFTVLTDGERIKLYRKMVEYQINCHRPKPSHRTYIKKKNGKLRPLSIPTIKDRIYQNIAKMALEPQWEARVEPTSYGFRPKRGCHDAIERIFKSCSQRKKRWIFEGDFKGCFDNLRHDYIMEQIKDFPGKTVTERWLKAGYVDNNVFNRTEKGSGQGSVISPLLANIALHGMEEQLGIKYKTFVRSDGYQCAYNKTRYAITRYADDFVIMCKSKEDAEEIYDKLKPYLESRGLELESSKTRVVEITKGFDFLSFNIRIYQTSTGEKLLIKPSKDAVKKSMRQISDKVHELNGHKVGKVIHILNPIIIGKANYWSPMVSKETFSKMDYHIYKVNRRFLERLHPKKSAKWINKRYYKPDLTGKTKNTWTLTDPIDNIQLKKMMQIPIIRHTMIKHNASPYDATLREYFKMRDKKYNDKTRNQDNLDKKYARAVCRESDTYSS